MIKDIYSNDKFINNYESILKYLTFQKINIDNNLFNEIHELSQTNNNVNDCYKDIIRQLNLFKDLKLGNDTDYLYYILILESLPNFMIRNLFRLFTYNYILLFNNDLENPDKKEKNKILKNITFKKLKYKILDVNKSNNPKDILLQTLEHLSDNNNNILFFIYCINLFFT
tara:strand:- start:721 stop:1230 length:510 start_codon:yes stop_codon:yes gene_type:complete